MIALVVMFLFSAAPTATADDAGDPEVPFGPVVQTFADAPACAAWLEASVRASARAVAARGPYRIGPGDVRAHRVDAVTGGHEITEWRCRNAALAERRWTQQAMGEGEVAPFTMSDLNAMKY